jgi:hypothetical protein
MPLSMSVAEFLFITNQLGQGDLRYSFAPDPAPPFNPHQPPRLRQGKPETRYPPPAEKMPPSIPLSDSIGGLFHSGFSLFSNSFGTFPPSLDGLGLRLGGEAKGQKIEDTISLRKNLELEILKR